MFIFYLPQKLLVMLVASVMMMKKLGVFITALDPNSIAF